MPVSKWREDWIQKTSLEKLIPICVVMHMAFKKVGSLLSLSYSVKFRLYMYFEYESSQYGLLNFKMFDAVLIPN